MMKGNGNRKESLEGNGDFIYYAELLDRAHKDGLKGVFTELVQIPTKENQFTAISFARIQTNRGTFTGHGDACPTNVDPEIAPHIIRAAETRAKARALRDAVNVGMVAAEELNGGSPDGFEQRGTEVRTGEDGHPPETQKSAEPKEEHQSPQSEEKNENLPSDLLMTDAQKRYLFRIMASQGFEGDVAQDQLKKLLHTDSLKMVTKAQASQLIEELLAKAEGGGQ